MIKVNEETIQDFIKLLIQCDGSHEVRQDHTVVTKDDSKPVMIQQAASEKPLVVFYSGAPTSNDVIWLNPFKELTGKFREREWFYNLLDCMVGRLTKLLIMRIAHDCAKQVDNNYNEFPLMNKIRKFVDDKTHDEINKIGSSVFLSIVYNRTKRTAYAQTGLVSEQTSEKFQKIKKKTWDAIHTIFSEIFDDNTLELEEYSHTSKNLDIPETEAKLSVFIALISKLDPFTNDVMGLDLHSAELREHLAVLDGYAKLYEWAIVSKVDTCPQTPTSNPALATFQTSPTGTSFTTVSQAARMAMANNMYGANPQFGATPMFGVGQQPYAPNPALFQRQPQFYQGQLPIGGYVNPAQPAPFNQFGNQFGQQPTGPFFR